MGLNKIRESLNKKWGGVNKKPLKGFIKMGRGGVLIRTKSGLPPHVPALRRQGSSTEMP